MPSRRDRRAGEGWGASSGAAEPSSYQASGSSGDSKYLKTVSAIESDLRVLSKAVSSVEGATRKLGTAKDSEELRMDT